MGSYPSMIDDMRDDVAVTPEMVDAGVHVIVSALSESEGMISARGLAEQVYRAMNDARNPATGDECAGGPVRCAGRIRSSRERLPETQENLTDREIELLKWTAYGKTFAEISMIMGISVNTANNHVKSAMFKLRTPNRAAAVFRAAMLGLLN
jgi:DNA-binding CsgD family transcriptional regulator